MQMYCGPLVFNRLGAEDILFINNHQKSYGSTIMQKLNLEQGYKRERRMTTELLLFNWKLLLVVRTTSTSNSLLLSTVHYGILQQKNFNQYESVPDLSRRLSYVR